MIYISVDNDHHGDLALSLIQKRGYTPEDVTFISHVSQRNNTIPASNYRRQVVDGHPLSSGSGYKNPLSYIRAFFHQRWLRSAFHFRPGDILFIITEYQLNNALFALEMKRAGGRVYLFDEGIGFYFNNSPFHKAHTGIGACLFLLAYDLIFASLGIPAYAKKGFEGRMYVRIRETFIDAIYSRMRLPIDRPAHIRGYRNFLASEQALIPKDVGTVMFFANNLEHFGLKTEELRISGEALLQMASVFSVIHLKIHPADWIAKNDVYDFYVGIAATYSNVVLVANTMSSNEALERIRPAVVVGTLGAAMFDAFFFGCQPVFLFHLLPHTEEFGICAFTLNNLGYQYIDRVEHIAPSYRSGVDISALLYEELPAGAPLEGEFTEEVSAIGIDGHAVSRQEQPKNA